MCYHRSFIVMDTGRVLSHPRSDHHTEIRKEHRIREAGFIGEQAHCAVECVPEDSLFNVESYKLIIDEKTPPDWWDKSVHEKAVRNELHKQLSRRIHGRSYVTEASVEVPMLPQLELGAKVISDGTVLLDYIRELRGVTIVCDTLKMSGNVRRVDECNLVCNRFETNAYDMKEFLLRDGTLNIRDRRSREGHREMYNPYIQHRVQPTSTAMIDWAAGQKP